jgi:hypothetical protein
VASQKLSENSRATIAKTTSSVGCCHPRPFVLGACACPWAGGGIRVRHTDRAARPAAAAPTMKAKRQLSAVAASAPMSSGVRIPARLTDTSPSLIATARWAPWRSDRTAHSRMSADVASRLITNAAAIVIAGVWP